VVFDELPNDSYYELVKPVLGFSRTEYSLPQRRSLRLRQAGSRHESLSAKR